MSNYTMLVNQIESMERNLNYLKSHHKQEVIKFFHEFKRVTNSVGLTLDWVDSDSSNPDTSIYNVLVFDEHGDIIMEYMVDAYSTQQFMNFKAHISEKMMPQMRIRHKYILMQKKLKDKEKTGRAKVIKV